MVIFCFIKIFINNQHVNVSAHYFMSFTENSENALKFILIWVTVLIHEVEHSV